MSKISRRPPGGIVLIAVIAAVALLNIAFDDMVLEQLGTTMGALVMIGGSLYLIGCLYWMERSR
jgi:hypothetical protein